MEAIDILGRTLRRLAIAVAVIILLGVIFALWVQLTIMVWGRFGDATFEYWLLGTALLIALGLVIVW